MDDSHCERKRKTILIIVMFIVYSLMGAVVEHLNTNLHYPIMTLLNPEKYPKRIKVQHNPVLTGFPAWGLALLLVWQLDAYFKRTIFKTPASQKSVAKLLFDFSFWTVVLTLLELVYGKMFAGKKGYKSNGLLYTYDYSYINNNYAGAISPTTSLMWGILVVIFIRINPHLINFLRQGIDASVCPAK